MYDDDEFLSDEESRADIKSSEKVENDEITPGEEGFMQGYEETDEDDSENNPYSDE